mmetsp:Transcript_53127/g.78762  ORF Transcript_53127/g.78762 Transcript_53127/m.78762 type:complete len:277 (-) Transcript_53127:844-1674(-)
MPQCRCSHTPCRNPRYLRKHRIHLLQCRHYTRHHNPSKPHHRCRHRKCRTRLSRRKHLRNPRFQCRLRRNCNFLLGMCKDLRHQRHVWHRRSTLLSQDNQHMNCHLHRTRHTRRTQRHCCTRHRSQRHHLSRNRIPRHTKHRFRHKHHSCRPLQNHHKHRNSRHLSTNRHSYRDPNLCRHRLHKRHSHQQPGIHRIRQHSRPCRPRRSPQCNWSRIHRKHHIRPRLATPRRFRHSPCRLGRCHCSRSRQRSNTIRHCSQRWNCSYKLCSQCIQHKC